MLAVEVVVEVAVEVVSIHAVKAVSRKANPFRNTVAELRVGLEGAQQAAADRSSNYSLLRLTASCSIRSQQPKIVLWYRFDCCNTADKCLSIRIET